MLRRHSIARCSSFAATTTLVAMMITRTPPSPRSAFPSRHRMRTTTTVAPAASAVDAFTPTQRPLISRYNRFPLPSPSTSPNLLLLEGDTYHVHDGVARTLYHAVPDDTEATSPLLLIHEQYHINSCRKTFQLRHGNIVHQVQRPGMLRIIEPEHDNEKHDYYHHVTLQELDHSADYITRIGTGATSWDASLVMACYFAQHNVHNQHVVEVGCGVGLAGLLLRSLLCTTAAGTAPHTTTLTLTDGSDVVLQQCKDNVVRQQQQEHSNQSNVNFAVLNWHDHVPKPHLHAYQVVIANDCAYRPHDVPALARTLNALLSHDAGSTIHLFGPVQRAHLHQVGVALQELGLHVTMDETQLYRYRLRDNDNPAQLYSFASQSTSTFVHIMASPPPSPNNDDHANPPSLLDID